MPKLVPKCLATVDIIAIPTAQHSKDPSVNPAPLAALQEQIKSEQYLELLYFVALNCQRREEHIAAFWRLMEFDFVLLILHKAQPPDQMRIMLNLLGTSILRTSFGSISTNASVSRDGIEITRQETNIVDRLCVLLFENPSPPGDGQSYDARDTLKLRASVLSLLRSLATDPRGGRLLATHRLLFGRLVRFLHEAILAMYSYRPVTHAATTSLVNATVLLLSRLTTEYADIIDVRGKLATVPGGAHKHLISLSRVAFGDGHSVLEDGIQSEAAEAAHRMLDEHLSPEEGEAVVEVFSSAKA